MFPAEKISKVKHEVTGFKNDFDQSDYKFTHGRVQCKPEDEDIAKFMLGLGTHPLQNGGFTRVSDYEHAAPEGLRRRKNNKRMKNSIKERNE